MTWLCRPLLAFASLLTLFIGVACARQEHRPRPNTTVLINNVTASALPAGGPLAPEEPRPAPCQVTGTGAPNYNLCHPSELTILEETGRTPIAILYSRRLSVVWDFRLKDPHFARLRAETGGITIDGVASFENQDFVLLQDIPIVAEHSWFRAGTLVRLAGYAKGHLVVRGPTLLPTPSELETEAECESLAYQPESELKLDKSAHAFSSQTSSVPTKGAELAVSARPNAPPFLVVRSAPGDPLAHNLVLLEQSSGYVRVQRATASFAFDGWVPEHQLAIGGARFQEGISLGSICSTSWRDGPLRNASRVRQSSWILVGEHPQPETRRRFRVTEGAHVASLAQRENGYVDVLPAVGGIRPPQGERFWLKETALGAD